jgi:copper transporter 1
MLLNWHTIDACFLSSAFHIRSSFTFFLACLSSFLLVISLEYIRRSQRAFDRYLRARRAHSQPDDYVLAEEGEENLIIKEGVGGTRWTGTKEKTLVVAAEQLLRGI